jgi:AcrR family transcriptional regulator
MTLTPRQQVILDHALDATREAGLAGLTMKKIAKRVGFTEPALYRHFPTKQDLLLGLVARMESLLLGRVREITAGEGSPRDKLERILAHHVGLVLRTDGLPFLLLAEAAAGGNRELGERLLGAMRPYAAHLAALLAQTTGTADRPPPEEVAFLFLGLPAMLAIHHRVSPDAELERRLARDLVPYLVERVAGSSTSKRAPTPSRPRASIGRSPARARSASALRSEPGREPAPSSAPRTKERRR